MVGSPNYSDPQISGAVNGALVPRQPGSAIKPFTYAAALQANYTPATVLYDVRTVYQTAEGDPYIPINYDRAYHGPITLRHALATSSNVAAVQILNDLGLQSLLDLGHRCGLRWYGNPNKFGLALTLGGSEVRLLDLTGAYACFAAGGIRRAPKAIATIHNPAGDPIPWPKPDGERVLDERVAYLITDILADDHARLPAFGERSALFIGRPAAVKTGTTTNWRDNWTVGYTPELTVGVWLGNADNVPMRKMMGATGAAPIWHRFMGKVLADRPIIRFDSPRLVEKAVCPVTGLVSSLACPEQYYEKFVPGTEPVETCNAHRLYRIDAATGLVATALTPPSEIITRTYVSLPPQAQEWGQARGIPAPPDRIDSPSRGKDSDLLEINQPAANTRYVLDDTLPSEAQIIEFSVQWHGTRPAPAIALFLDNEPLTTWSEPPYTYPWPLRPGEHTLLARTVSKSPPVTSQLLRFYVEP
jgi:membrane carboxypeptidase/penicillin-binding protein PbpC